MFHFNLFNVPLEPDTLDAWLKILDDIAKVAILALPVLVYGQGTLLFKIINTILLIVLTYICLKFGRSLRKNRDQLVGGKYGK